MGEFAEVATAEAARKIAARLYKCILAEHDWGQRCDPEPSGEQLDRLMDMPPREMRRALMTGFGNARLDGRYHVTPEDLPQAGGSRQRMGFLS